MQTLAVRLAACMSLASVSVGAAACQSAAGSSCAGCRSAELGALFGLSDGLSVAVRSGEASERLTAGGVYGTARHKLHQAAAAIEPLLHSQHEQLQQARATQQRHSRALRQRVLGLSAARAASLAPFSSAAAAAAAAPASPPPLSHLSPSLPLVLPFPVGCRVSPSAAVHLPTAQCAHSVAARSRAMSACSH